MLGPEFAFHPVAFPIKKGSTFDIKKKIDPIIKKIKEDGRIEELRVKYWETGIRKRHCSDYRKLSNGIPLRNSGGMFIIILVGLAVALAVVSVENVVIGYFQAVDQKADSENHRPRGFFSRIWMKFIIWVKAKQAPVST